MSGTAEDAWLEGETLKAEGDLQGARRQYQEALDVQQRINKIDPTAEAQVPLADLDLEEAHPEHTEPLLRRAITEFEKEKRDPDATGAYTLLSRALMMQGKLEESTRAVQRAVELDHTSPDPALKLPIAIQNARIETAGATPNTALAAARHELRSAMATARKLGYYSLECEARLALGELELKANPPLGRSLLKDLADDARGRGLQLISRKAANLAASPNAIAAAIR